MNASEHPEPSHALSTAIYQHHLVTQQHTGHCALFLLLFLFLYCILGAALTFDSSPAVIDSVTIYYALTAIPVLVAFSGLFCAILFLF